MIEMAPLDLVGDESERHVCWLIADLERRVGEVGEGVHQLGRHIATQRHPRIGQPEFRDQWGELDRDAIVLAGRPFVPCRPVVAGLHGHDIVELTHAVSPARHAR